MRATFTRVLLIPMKAMNPLLSTSWLFAEVYSVSAAFYNLVQLFHPLVRLNGKLMNSIGCRPVHSVRRRVESGPQIANRKEKRRERGSGYEKCLRTARLKKKHASACDQGKS
jgi:hypothetical protein